MTYPKRSLSQNFLVDKNIRRKLVETLDAGPADRVVEIGAGHGELSELLVGRVGRLVLVEKDDRLAPELAARWAGRDDVAVVHGDALELDLSALSAESAESALSALSAATPDVPDVEDGVDPRSDENSHLRLISNLPYAITSPLLFRMLDVRPPADRIVVLVQEEVARRITAEPGGKEYGALTVGVQTQARAELAFRVGRRAFRPVPGVDSAAVVLEPTGAVLEPTGATRDAGRHVPLEAGRDAVRRLTRAAFSRRRKQIRTILRSAPEYGLSAKAAEAVLGELDIAVSARPETLTPAEFVALAAGLERQREQEGSGG